MLDSQGEETRDARKRANSVSGSEKRETVIRPLCGCSSKGEQFVVFTCPRCMGVALRAFQELTDAEIT